MLLSPLGKHILSRVQLLDMYIPAIRNAFVCQGRKKNLVFMALLHVRELSWTSALLAWINSDLMATKCSIDPVCPGVALASGRQMDSCLSQSHLARLHVFYFIVPASRAFYKRGSCQSPRSWKAKHEHFSACAITRNRKSVKTRLTPLMPHKSRCACPLSCGAASVNCFLPLWNNDQI